MTFSIKMKDIYKKFWRNLVVKDYDYYYDFSFVYVWIFFICVCMNLVSMTMFVLYSIIRWPMIIVALIFLGCYIIYFVFGY